MLAEELSTVKYENDRRISDALYDFARNTLDKSTDRYGAEDDIGSIIEDAIETFESDLRYKLERLLDEWEKEPCGYCDGSCECPDCYGTGKEDGEEDDGEDCPQCSGTGQCPECEGSGLEFVRD